MAGYGVGGRGLSINFSGGASGIVGTVTVPSSQYPTVASVLSAIDATGFKAAGVTIQLGAGVFVENFDWTDKDYSGVKIKGAPIVSDFITAFNSLTGAAGNYTFTFTTSLAVAAATSVGDFVLIETGAVPNTEDRAKIVGFWEVLTVNTGTGVISVRLTCMDTGTANPAFTADIWRCTKFTSMFDDTDQNTPWIKATRTFCPVFSDVGVTGTYKGNSPVATGNHIGVFLLDGSTFYTDTVPSDAVLTDHGVYFALSGFNQGFGLLGSKCVGSHAVSGCFMVGVVVYASGLMCVSQGMATGNGRNGNGNGYTAYLGGSLNFATFSVGGNRANVASGNGGRGVNASMNGDLTFLTGASIGNASTDVEAVSNSRISLGSLATLALGTSSPAVNTLGNNNSYVRRP